MTAAWYLSRSFWFRIFRVVLVGATFWFIWNEVFVQRSFDAIRYELLGYLKVANIPALGLLLLLTVVNWSLEAAKWQLLVKPLEQISFGRAAMAVLAGISPGLFTPNRVGEFGGRILFLKNADPAAAVAATAVGSLGLVVVAIGLGAAGLNFYVWHMLHAGYWVGVGLAFVSLIASVGLVLAFVNIRRLGHLQSRHRLLQKVLAKTRVLAGYSQYFLVKVLCLSLLRYVVFAGQYVLLLWLFGCSFGIVAMFACVCVIFLVQAAVPTVALLELGFRGASAIGVLSVYTSNELGIVLSAFVLWFVNIVLPALAGLPFYWKIKE